MSLPLSFSSHRNLDRFLILHAAVIPACIVLIALIARASGLDDHLATAFFDAATAGFPARQSVLLETLGHRVAKSAVWGLWLLLLTLAVAASFVPRLHGLRGLLWAVVAAMGAGPALVVVLKGLNSYRCPWDLAQFGGYAQATSGWFVARGEAGQCFPSGHAAGGFALIALFFAGVVLGRPVIARIGLLAAVTAGGLFSAVRMAQGAHFLSHNLWAAAIDWAVAALIFAPLLLSRLRVAEPS